MDGLLHRVRVPQPHRVRAGQQAAGLPQEGGEGGPQEQVQQGAGHARGQDLQIYLPHLISRICLRILRYFQRLKCIDCLCLHILLKI